MVKLFIDIMGGDFAPDEIIKGVNIALDENKDLELVLFGDENIIKNNVKHLDRVKIVNAPDKIDMGEKDPIGEVRRNQ